MIHELFLGIFWCYNVQVKTLCIECFALKRKKDELHFE